MSTIKPTFWGGQVSLPSGAESGFADIAATADGGFALMYYVGTGDARRVTGQFFDGFGRAISGDFIADGGAAETALSDGSITTLADGSVAFSYRTSAANMLGRVERAGVAATTVSDGVPRAENISSSGEGGGQLRSGLID